MKVAIIANGKLTCCLCNKFDSEKASEAELLLHLKTKHNRELITVEERKHCKVYHGTARTIVDSWR